MKKIYYKPSVSIFSIETGSFMAGSYTGEARAKSSPTEMFDDLHLSDNISVGIKINRNLWSDETDNSDDIWTYER